MKQKKIKENKTKRKENLQKENLPQKNYNLTKDRKIKLDKIIKSSGFKEI